MILQSNYAEFSTPQFRKLSDDQLERLHNASLEILDRTGVCLYEQEALDLLKKAGVKISEENRVHIPPSLVEWALSIAPKRVVLCDRHGRRVMPLERNIDRKMRETNAPGVAVAITDREKLLRQACYGYANLSARTPIAPEHLFEIASIGKSFTAIALMQQHQAGRLDLHAPVSNYLPWFEIQSKCEPITTHHLLSHTAGITAGSDLAPHGLYKVYHLRQMEAASPPGERFHYCNVGYQALGFLLEEMLGVPYPEILQTQILDPLEMTATHPALTFETRKHTAWGYRSLYDDRPFHPNHPLIPVAWYEFGTAEGSPASTAGDMATYVRMLLNRGHGPQGRILSEESFELMIEPVIREMGDIFYGYGLEITEVEEHTVIGHTGGGSASRSAILADMDEGLGVVVLVNAAISVHLDIAQFALKLLGAATHNQEMPPLPPLADPTEIDNAADYAGTYHLGDETIHLLAEGKRLVLQYGSERVVLERRGKDSFFAGHPDLSLFLLHCRRDREGQVVEVFHGPDWYVGDRYHGPTAFDHPPEWAAYAGHYRSHNFWIPTFRVVLRKGALVLIEPGGEEQPLSPLGEAAFRVGQEEHSPERIRFDAIVNGRALQAHISGCDYYRTFTL